jgi:hypothetical protein
MRSLSIRQPWAWLIIQGHKDVENREWSTDYVGPLLIHASKTAAKREYAELRETLHEEMGILVPELEVIERGGIVGMVDLLGCADDSDSPWYTGAIAWRLANPRPLPFHPCKGALQLFHTPLADLGLRDIDFPMGRRVRDVA